MVAWLAHSFPYNLANGEIGFRAGAEDRAGDGGRRGVDVLRAAGGEGRGEDVRVRAVPPVGRSGVAGRADGLREAGRTAGGGAGEVLLEGPLCGVSERAGAVGEGRGGRVAGAAGGGDAVREESGEEE